MEVQQAEEAGDSRPAGEAGDTRPARADTQTATEPGADTQSTQEAAETQPGREVVRRVEPQPAAEAAGQRKCAACRNSLRNWRPSLWVSVPLASAFTLFVTLVSVERSPFNLWTVSAVVVIVILLIVAGVAAFFCSTMTPEGPHRGGEQEV